MTRKICVVSGSRSDYGLLKWVLAEIRDDPALDLQLVVTGSHLSAEFGYTYKQIEADGFFISDALEILLDSNTANAVAKSAGLGLMSFADSFSRLKPEIVLILGDRYEIFAAAAAASLLHIPIAHCHGGERTEGALDEVMRHAITKLSHLHFTSTKTYRKRVVQLGEHPDRVFNVGALGLESVQRDTLLNRSECEKQLGAKLLDRYLLIAYHPETLALGRLTQDCNELLVALDEVPDLQLVFSLSNADEGGREINRLINDYVTRNQDRCIVRASFGHKLFLSLMQFASGMVGNSSSALIEAPSFGLRCLNIGDRQKGRVKSPLTMDCSADSKEIKKRILQIVLDENDPPRNPQSNPYWQDAPAQKIKDQLKRYPIHGLQKKTFWDLEV